MKKSCLKCSSYSSASAPGPSASSPSRPGPSSSWASASLRQSQVERNANPNGRPPCHRQVSFRDSCEFEVHTADDWDRSPVDINPNLSYEYVSPTPTSQTSHSLTYLTAISFGRLPPLVLCFLARTAQLPPALTRPNESTHGDGRAGTSSS